MVQSPTRKATASPPTSAPSPCSSASVSPPPPPTRSRGCDVTCISGRDIHIGTRRDVQSGCEVTCSAYRDAT
eukprot:3241413-Rhodomonas_salina.4